MASPKRNKFSREDIRVARFAKAMSHPARVAVLRMLAAKEACYFNEISKKIPLAGSTVSQHMYELKRAGIVQDSYEPPRIKYSIDSRKWKQARRYFRDFLKIKQGK
ncbi:MAG: helix-turn-helix transcriptional regulator [Bacteroidales bacterium]|nr:helix-turn-helix transcriptional regulator [Bacteroidales bacterium]